MKSSNIPYFFLLLLPFFITACHSNKTEKANKTTALTKADISETTVKNWTIQDAQKTAEAKFAQYLPKILKDHDGALEVQQTYIGDFTGDNIPDVAIYFSMSPVDGNAPLAPGIVLYKNTGKEVEVIGGYEPGYLFSADTISNGKVYIVKEEYNEDDAMCCPSVKSRQVLNIDGNQVTASDVNQNQP